jgi:hypothetical protein
LDNSQTSCPHVHRAGCDQRSAVGRIQISSQAQSGSPRQNGASHSSSSALWTCELAVRRQFKLAGVSVCAVPSERQIHSARAASLCLESDHSSTATKAQARRMRSLIVTSLLLMACGSDNVASLHVDLGVSDACIVVSGPIDCPAHADQSFSWYFRVCGANGKTYGTWEEATCAGVAYRPGDCDPQTCAIGDPGPPVCGSDGKTYPGDQTAGCFGALRAAAGPCSPDGG